MRAWLLVLAACGDNAAAPIDAAPDADPASGCTASWSGNFAEVVASECPAIAGDGTFTVTATASQLVEPMQITIALGGATPGIYTSSSVTDWHAAGAGGKVQHMCLYVAGSDVVPHGSFVLELPHRLELQLAVLAQPFTYCGDSNSETVTLTF